MSTQGSIHAPVYSERLFQCYCPKDLRFCTHLTHAKHFKAMVGDAGKTRGLSSDLFVEFLHGACINILHRVTFGTGDVMMIVSIVAEFVARDASCIDGSHDARGRKLLE